MPPPSAPVDPLTGLSAARFGVYVHFPFCLSKCPYCDFASVVASTVPQRRYADAVLRELGLRLERWPHLVGSEVHSIFFGGGTPSLWDPAEVARVLAGITARLPLAPGAEVTLEANPGAADASRFASYRALGVNRISIGVQSFQAPTLAALGREHDGEMARRAFAAAREAGFENVSLDFIYGAPGQRAEQAELDARTALTLGPEHLSAYALTLDKEALAEEVKLARQVARGEVILPDEDAVLEMGHSVREAYRGSGVERYEISNYAKPGYHSRHNALYWTGGEYLSVGVGATGCIRQGSGAERYSNHRSPEQYFAAVAAGRLPEASTEALTSKELFEERVAMGLRLTGGVDLQRACEESGEDWAPRSEQIARLVEGGLARCEHGRVALTEAGADLHSAIAARLM